jgi:hypothetical protein
MSKTEQTMILISSILSKTLVWQANARETRLESYGQSPESDVRARIPSRAARDALLVSS